MVSWENKASQLVNINRLKPATYHDGMMSNHHLAGPPHRQSQRTNDYKQEVAPISQAEGVCSEIGLSHARGLLVGWFQRVGPTNTQMGVGRQPHGSPTIRHGAVEPLSDSQVLEKQPELPHLKRAPCKAKTSTSVRCVGCVCCDQTLYGPWAWFPLHIMFVAEPCTLKPRA